MSRSLTALQIEKLTKPGRYAVGEGVYLQISKPKEEGAQGTRSWLFRYERSKRQHWMVLGSCSLIRLAQAHQKGRDARRELLEGVDPLAERSASDFRQAPMPRKQ